MSSHIIKQEKKSNAKVQNLILILIVAALVVIPLFIHKDAEFGGADGNAEQAITEMNAEYEPWFAPIWEPPSSEVESLLFALQAALGAGFIGYYLGYGRGRKQKEDCSKV